MLRRTLGLTRVEHGYVEKCTVRIFTICNLVTSRLPHRYTYSYSQHRLSPKFDTSTILPTDLHRIERIRTISKD
jgi:hypothetical protein